MFGCYKKNIRIQNLHNHRCLHDGDHTVKWDDIKTLDKEDQNETQRKVRLFYWMEEITSLPVLLL